MDLIFIGVVSFLAAGLTFFTGFGLGTILLPVFALFFPIPTAVAATAVVHLINNLFKSFLTFKQTNWKVAVNFSIPAVIAAAFGAYLLIFIDRLPVAFSYEFGSDDIEVQAVALVVGVIIVSFAFFEFLPKTRAISFSPKFIPLGGLISGFFGGLTGNQGALRSAFLLRAKLSKESFVATSAVAALLVDLTRIFVYGNASFFLLVGQSEAIVQPVLVATIGALAGATFSRRWLSKTSLRFVEILTATMMVVIGILLILGLI
jgi:uncharacterized membrane protein YfcA